MADLELLYLEKTCRQPDPSTGTGCALNQQSVPKPTSSGGKSACREDERSPAQRAPDCQGQHDAAPWTAPPEDGGVLCRHGWPAQDSDIIKVYCDEELETSFANIDENVELQRAALEGGSRGPCGPPCHSTPNNVAQDMMRELSLISDDELASQSSEKSVDYGFISAVTFLVTGISLVVISYTVPRDVTVNPDVVSAREMERLEKESARIGAHLDRCVIAGLCLLTLGGVVLSTLLMISMWKGEMYRRKAFAYSKQSAKLYGSINFRAGLSSTRASPQLSEDEEDGDILT